MVRTGMAVYDWMCWRMNKKAEDRQRRELGLPTATVASPRRIAERGSLEIQAYDDVCFPGLADEWAKWGGQRPFVGSLTMELTTDCDDEVLAWIAQGTPPICFGFGSMPVAESPADTVRMIGAACAELGERALICSGWSDFSDVPSWNTSRSSAWSTTRKSSPPVARSFITAARGPRPPVCARGIPSLILWTAGDQPMWGSRVKQLKVGTSRRFSSATPETLIADLRTILAPEYTTRARELATRMSKPRRERRARRRSVGRIRSFGALCSRGIHRAKSLSNW